MRPSSTATPTVTLGAVLCAVLWLGASVAAQYQGWLIPPGGKDETSPLTRSPQVLRQGADLFAAHCARCHGPEGKGNGPDADYAADLTDEYRFALNTDGVLFYKVWNGHAVQLRTQIDDMPPFKDRLTREQVWAVVEHLKTFRAPR